MKSDVAKLDRWKHNGLIGNVAMQRAQMRAIMCSHTATELAKELAGDILDLNHKLETELRTNRVEDGVVVPTKKAATNNV